ncbi:MAG: isoprenylcysteine carboxylmethyltransferase family protein [Chloroflexi bacterium]|nr:isoprenylcysteine carboxylmethyltransferase family protein [Chloroflexota bacterium]
MKDRILKQAAREYSPRARIAALALEAVFFLLILPSALTAGSANLDQWLALPRFVHPLANALVGALCIAGGLLFALWSIYAQFTIGRGTPVPLMATQKLVIQPPYSYCRNPMTLGAIGLYFGIAIVLGSISAALLVLLGSVALLSYIRRVEEKEMELRFGQAYGEYKKRTPFLIPRF